MHEDGARLAAELTVGELFDDQVAAQPDAIALQWVGGGCTFRQLRDQAHRLCALFASRGVGPGDRIAVLSENRWEYVATLLAGAKMGAITACLNWRQSAEELDHCLRLVTPRAALISPRFKERLGLIEASGATCIFHLGQPLDDLLAASSAGPPATRPRAEDGLQIVYTSGTTGKPKAALISHRALIARGVVGAIDGLYRRGDTFVAWPPMFHVASADYAQNTLLNGGKVIVLDGPQIDVLCDIIATEERLGWLQLMPGMIDKVLEEVRRRGIKPKPVHLVGSSADLLPRQLIAEVTRLFNAPLRNTFGSTEAGPAPGGAGVVTMGVAPENLDKKQSSLCRVRLADEEGRDVALGEPGELLLRSPTLFSGYWGMPEATAEAFADGWFHTGDVFIRTPEGNLRFVDRRKYLIKSGGENIYPAEIEQVLMASDRIADVAVVRKRDPKWGEVPLAFVVPADPDLTAEEVIALCRGRIANFKLPKEVRFVAHADLPRNVTGKIMRNLLEERIADPRGG
jgi:fatty-acyl-CoA synthase